MKRLLLIDGSNLMFRAYYATAYSGNLMRNSKGEYTNAVYAFTNMLNRIREEHFTHVLVAFDKGKATFRHKAYEEYKAKRKPMPDEFKSQLSFVKEVPKKLGMAVHESEEIEADDIIGSFANRHYDDFDAIEIISNDRDLYQLLNHKVTMRIAKRGLDIDETYTQKSLEKDFGISPAQVPDLKGLMGDASDNIPGIPGVGEKTALRLLHEYGSIENILKNLNELKGKLKERISENADEALRWRDLAKVKLDAEIGPDLAATAYEGPDKSELKNFYERMEFHSLLKRLEGGKKKNKAKKTVIIRDEKKIPAVLRGHVHIVLEAFGENYHHAERLGFGLESDAGCFFIPYDVFLASESMKDFLADDACKKSTFNLKRMNVMLKQDGVELRGVTFDLLLAVYCLNPSYADKDFRVVSARFGEDDVPYLEEVYGKGAKSAVPDETTYTDYAVKKASLLAGLEEEVASELEKREQTPLFQDIEMPLAPILARMEERGVRIDLEALKDIEKQLDEELDSITEEIHHLAGTSFNIASPKQLAEVLFERLDLPVLRKTKTGPSTSIDVLKKLADRHPIIKKIMRHRTVNKLKTAYVKSLFDAAKEGRIHTIYKQALTQTGRLSSIEPNLQTIPIRTETGRKLRRVFRADEGCVLLTADYSQIELRLLAHMAKEKELIRAFEEGEDIHTHTGREILGKQELSADERRLAKAVNFGIIYGQSPYGLSEELSISVAEARRFIERYYERFPGIKAFMDKVIEQAEKEGFVETLYGRRRYIPEMKSKIHAQRENGKRIAMNAPLQGSAADIIKIAMILVEQALVEKDLQSRLVLQIHDELVLNVKEEEQDVVKDLVKEKMEGAADLLVPLTTEVALGGNLDEAK